MKASPTRYIRRRKKSSADGSFFKKESQEQGFFADQTHEPFFQPAPQSVQRMCADCDKEDTSAGVTDKKTGEDKKVQRMPEKKEEEKKLQKKEADKKEEEKKLHKKGDDKKEEEKKLHKKGDEKKEDEKKLHKKEATATTNTAPVTSSYINTLSGKGSCLPQSSRHFFAERMGYDFNEVRIHTGQEANESAREMNAKAYTLDNHIVFSEGQYNTGSFEGKKLLAHELTHVMQQDRGKIARKEGDAPEETCTAGSVDLEAHTAAGYNKGAGTVAKEKTQKSEGCNECEDSCVTITGTLKVPYNVTTNIKLPSVPANLTPCQEKRVSAAINGPLLTHEKQHVKAFETFNGTASLPVNYKGCEGGYTSHLEGLADGEFARRQSAADAKSAALDPFSVPVDLCCTDVPVKGK